MPVALLSWQSEELVLSVGIWQQLSSARGVPLARGVNKVGEEMVHHREADFDCYVTSLQGLVGKCGWESFISDGCDLIIFS